MSQLHSGFILLSHSLVMQSSKRYFASSQRYFSSFKYGSFLNKLIQTFPDVGSPIFYAISDFLLFIMLRSFFFLGIFDGEVLMHNSSKTVSFSGQLFSLSLLIETHFFCCCCSYFTPEIPQSVILPLYEHSTCVKACVFLA